jgi:DNA invertase Pin-like site-specific DNA recombinase
MANALVISKGTSLTKRDKALRAAQYVRMSTDYQRYSIQNQAAAIAAFAQLKNLTIVRTYVDEGRSGLRIRGRAGLIELIDDVSSGRADFDHILVYDVSRWGRFQDVDESAYYEFVCKQKGVKVIYCAEQFDNDGSLMSSIVKNIKRVMAAEFSRDLSVKVHAGHCRIASLGFRVGAPVAFGFRRELIDENKQSKGWLKRGQHKSLKTDRVLLRLGSPEEATIVRWIFHLFVVERKSDAAIARRLNRANAPNRGARPWTDHKVHNILQNENYVGNSVYNRTSRFLGQKRVKNPPNRWVRSEKIVEPIIDQSLFARAQQIMAERRHVMSDADMLRGLRMVLKRQGKLSFAIINKAASIPSAACYVKHFGSLRKIYALAGYRSPRNCDWIDTKEFWSGVLTAHATQVVEALNACKGIEAVFDENNMSVTAQGTKIFFFTARQMMKPKPTYLTQWRVYCRRRMSGWMVLLRLDDTAREIEDYLLLPASTMTGCYIQFSPLALHGATRVETVAELIANIKTRLQTKSKDRLPKRLSKRQPRRGLQFVDRL